MNPQFSPRRARKPGGYGGCWPVEGRSFMEGDLTLARRPKSRTKNLTRAVREQEFAPAVAALCERRWLISTVTDRRYSEKIQLTNFAKILLASSSVSLLPMSYHVPLTR